MLIGAGQNSETVKIWTDFIQDPLETFMILYVSFRESKINSNNYLKSDRLFRDIKIVTKYKNENNIKFVRLLIINNKCNNGN